MKHYREKRKPHLADLNRDWRAANREHCRAYKDTYYRSLLGRCVELRRCARRRALRGGLACDITTEFVMALWEQQQGKCALSGISLVIPPTSTGGGHHYDAPSIDQIKPSQGYTQDNVRLLCYGMNCCIHDFGEEVFQAVAEGTLYGKPHKPPKTVSAETRVGKQLHDKHYRESARGVVTALLHNAKKNAAEKGLSFNLTKMIVGELVGRQPVCAVSGIQFDFTVLGGGKANPFRPSIDRIDSERGYEPDNVRLVSVAVNYGINEFGDNIFRELCSGFLEHTGALVGNPSTGVSGALVEATGPTRSYLDCNPVTSVKNYTVTASR